MDLIFTNKNREDIGVLHNYEFDLAFGTDENNFECVVGQNDHHCEFGSFLYIEGTEYGGIVDSIKSKNSTKEVVYSGRTWHGIMNSKVLQPDDGQAYLTVTGEANSVVASLVARMGLSDLFEVSTENSGLVVNSYKMNRYINGYDGILKMLKTVGGKLLFLVQNDCQVLLSVVPAVDYTKEELDSDLLDLDVTQTKNTVNHLICLGSGELENRTVVHLYADANGNISQTQTFTGSEEYVAVFDYPNAEDEAELIAEGTDRLKELLQQNDISVDVNDVDDPYDIGDIVGASDSVTGVKITVPVAKKIVTIRNGTVTIDIKTETGNISKQSGGGYVGGGGESGEPVQGGCVNTNLLHNWYFADPIDQRGGYVVPPGTNVYNDSGLTSLVGASGMYYKVVETGSSYVKVLNESCGYFYAAKEAVVRGYIGVGYGIDRWRMIGDSGVALIHGGGLALHGQTSGAYYVQYLEGKELYDGKMYTYSVLYGNNNFKTISGIITEESPLILKGAPGGWDSVTISGEKIYAQLTANAGSSKTCVAAKLELGSEQTLAHQDENGNWVLNEAPPNKQQELAKCQRYQVVIGSEGHNCIGIGVGRLLGNPGDVFTSIPLPATLRAYPNITISGTVMSRNNGNYFSAIGIGEILCSPGGLLVGFITNNVTSGATYDVFTNPNTKLIIDANL